MKSFTLATIAIGGLLLGGCQTAGTSPAATSAPATASTTRPAAVKPIAGEPQMPDQTILVLDDLKTTTTAVFKGVRGFDAMDTTVVLRAKGRKLNDPDDVVLVADRIEFLGDGRTMAASFPSLAVWEFNPGTIEVYVGEAGKTPWRKFDTDRMVYRTRPPEMAAVEVPQQRPQAFNVTVTSQTIVADGTGHGALRIDFRQLDPAAKMQITLQGAQVEGFADDPKGVFSHNGDQWIVQSSGTVMLKLGNLSPSKDVVLSGQDSKGVTYTPVKFQVVHGQ